MGTLQALDPDEAQLDTWAAAGEAPTDWREQQQRLRHWLQGAPGCSHTPGPNLGSQAVQADREGTDR